MAIVGLYGNRNKLPRLGKIRLGSKALSKRTGQEYPEKSDHFICDDPRFIEVYGTEPKELDVMLISGDPDEVAPVFRKRYNSNNVLLCKGTGGEPGNPDMVGEAWEFNPDTQKRDILRTCPCHYAEEGKCGYVMNLFVMLPYVKGIGVWQIDTGGWNSIHSVLDFLAAMETLDSRGINVFRSIMKLKLVPKDTVIPGTTKSTKIYYLQFEVADRSLKDLIVELQKKQIALDHGEVVYDMPKFNTPSPKALPEGGQEIHEPEHKTIPKKEARVIPKSEPAVIPKNEPKVISKPKPEPKPVIDTDNLDNEAEMDLHPSETDKRVVTWVKKTRDLIANIIVVKKEDRNEHMNNILDEWSRVQDYVREHHIDSAEYLDYETLNKIRNKEL